MLRRKKHSNLSPYDDGGGDGDDSDHNHPLVDYDDYGHANVSE